MAIDKAKKQKRQKLPSFTLLHKENYSTAVEANDTWFSLTHERTKASDMEAVKDAPQPSWKDVALLIQNQINLLELIINLHNKLEDPVVAGVVALSSTVEKMRSEVEQLRDEMNDHVRYNNHERNDAW